MDAEAYRACDTDLLKDAAARAYWLDLFESYLPTQLHAAASEGHDAAACARAHRRMQDELNALRIEPDRLGRLDILNLAELRQNVLKEQGVTDEFASVKRRENEFALRNLPARLKALDALPDSEAWLDLIRGVLAGNLFDLGVVDGADRFLDTSPAFEDLVKIVPARPWLVDGFDDAMDSMRQHSPRRALLFCDNAGADIVLGLLPLARRLLLDGAEVMIAANHQPSLNDVTAPELRELLATAGRIDDAFRSDSLRVVDSGSCAPLLDLSDISDELANAAEGVDLLVIVGMGRAIESNFSARFACRSLKIAMLKDPQVARNIGGRLHDAVVHFEVGAG
jgi:uncharacterized protein with ATP-grasp and redox domains